MGVLKVEIAPGEWRDAGCFPAATTDSFARADGALGGPWTSFINGGTWAVSSNQASWSGTPVSQNPPGALLDVETEAVSLSVDFTVGTTTGSPVNNGGLVWNVLDEDNLYWLDVNSGGISTSGSIAVYRRSGGVFSTLYLSLATGTSGPGTYQIAHEPSGRITLIRNGVPLWEGTSPLTRGGTRAGIHIDNSAIRLDNASIRGLPNPLRLRLADGTWIREARPTQPANPLKIESPPGTWTTAVRMAAPDAFDPASVGTLEAWYEADQVNGADAGLPASSTTVASWSDLSGNGRTLTQTSFGLRPTFHDAGGGGYPFVQLDGVDDVLSTGSMAIPARTVLLMGRVTAAISYGGAVTGVTDNGQADELIFVKDAPTGNWYPGGYAITRDGVSTSAIGIGDGLDHIFVATASSTGSLTGLQLGLDRSNGGRYLAGRFYAVLVWSTVLSSGDLTATLSHFQAKYGTP